MSQTYDAKRRAASIPPLSPDCAADALAAMTELRIDGPADDSTLARAPGRKLLVLGDMGEVGDQGPQFHAEVGDYARSRGIPALYTLGEQSLAMGGTHFDGIEALNAAVLSQLPHAASILVKGSRFMKMERVVEAITRHEQQKEGA